MRILPICNISHINHKANLPKSDSLNVVVADIKRIEPQICKHVPEQITGNCKKAVHPLLTLWSLAEGFQFVHKEYTPDDFVPFVEECGV